MTILDLIPNEMKRVGAKDGGEYHGPCPLCGGTDRFHVWPGQGSHGTWWCRGCEKGGDAIQYLRDVEGMGYKQACKRLGVESNDYESDSLPHVKPVSGFTPAASITPAEKWAEKAGNFTEHCHKALLDNSAKRKWLSERGISQQMAEKYQLGWNEKDFWRDRTAWGLPEEIKPDGKQKKLWIPAGLVIPWSIGGSIHRLRIRRDEGEPRYYVVPGSGRSPMITSSQATAYIVVESELDAILLDAVAGDIAGIIAQGNSTAKPDQATWQPIQQALHVCVALDTDDAGAKASRWWCDQLQTARRWPVIGGKDPGEAYKAGADLKAWVLAGLPPALTVTQQQGVCHIQQQPSAPSFCCARLKSKSGHEYFVTDSPDEYRRLQAESATVFSPKEIGAVKEAQRLGATEHELQIMFELKRVLGGHLVKTEALPKETETP